MDRKTLDLAVPVAYVLAILVAALFVQQAVGPIAIIGAAVVAGWFSFVRPALKALERKRSRGDEERPYWYE